MNPALYEGTAELWPMLIVAGILWLLVIGKYRGRL